MQRRRLLATLGATASSMLAGCAVSGSDSPTRTPSTCDGHAPRRIELSGTGSVSDAADLSITATVERARSTHTAPATLAVTIENVGDDRAIDVTDGYFETGAYRFGTTVSVYSDEDADDPIRSVDWWLEITVSTVSP